MDKWLLLVKDMITLALFLVTAYGMVFKIADVWEKRKSLHYKDLEKRINDLEDCCKDMIKENIEIRAKAGDTWNLIMKWFEK